MRRRDAVAPFTGRGAWLRSHSAAFVLQQRRFDPSQVLAGPSDCARCRIRPFHSGDESLNPPGAYGALEGEAAVPGVVAVGVGKAKVGATVALGEADGE